MIEFICPRCSEELEADDTDAGKKSRCRSCNASLSIPPRSAKRPSEKKPANDLEQLAAYKKMVSPAVITSLFWIGTVFFILGGIGTIAGGFISWSTTPGTGSAGMGTAVTGIVFGFAQIILGPLMLRIWSELCIVMFKIHENIEAIRGFAERQRRQ